MLPQYPETVSILSELMYYAFFTNQLQASGSLLDYSTKKSQMRDSLSWPHFRKETFSGETSWKRLGRATYMYKGLDCVLWLISTQNDLISWLLQNATQDHHQTIPDLVLYILTVNFVSIHISTMVCPSNIPFTKSLIISL